MHQTAFSLFPLHTLPKLSVSISPNPGFISYGDGEKKNVKETCLSTVIQIYTAHTKNTIFLKKGKKKQLKNQDTMLSELRGICYAQ